MSNKILNINHANENLLDFIKNSPTPFHVVKNVKDVLVSEGYTELKENEAWKLNYGGRFFVTKADTSIIAFRIPESGINGMQIVASHSDSPTFKLKPNYEMKDNNYLRLSCEKYGGMINFTWLDKPLGVAGRILVKSGNSLKTYLVDSASDVCLIPSVAPHMMSNVNNGLVLSPTSDLVPLAGEASDEKKLLKLLINNSIFDSSNITVDDVVSHDLYLVNRQAGCVWGIDNSFISSPKLDDLQCAFTSLVGFVESGKVAEANSNTSTLTHMPVLAIFDNEEVGSSTSQGAGSNFFESILNRIVLGLNMTNEDYLRIIANSFIISADNAHAVHPNHPELSDGNNKAYLNQGIVIKHNACGRYVTEGASRAVFKMICDKANVPTVDYTNRSDMPGGSTLGHIALTNLPIVGVDIGLPQLSMHSSYETAGAKDTAYAIKLFTTYYNTVVDKNGDSWMVE